MFNKCPARRQEVIVVGAIGKKKRRRTKKFKCIKPKNHDGGHSWRASW